MRKNTEPKKQQIDFRFEISTNKLIMHTKILKINFIDYNK